MARAASSASALRPFFPATTTPVERAAEYRRSSAFQYRAYHTYAPLLFFFRYKL
jgi:hypothetical protein